MSSSDGEPSRRQPRRPVSHRPTTDSTDRALPRRMRLAPQALYDLTSTHIGARLAIVHHGYITHAPVIREAIQPLTLPLDTRFE